MMISVVMLRTGIFGKVAAYAGILGFALLLIFEVSSSFVAPSIGVTMVIAMAGGILSMTWYVLIARRLLQLGSRAFNAEAQ